MKKFFLSAIIVFFVFCCKSKTRDNNIRDINESPTKLRPNIVFLFADDQRYNTIHELGNNEIITPNIDRLVREGLTFTEASIMGAMNAAVCAPSRAMLLTGKSLFHIDPSGNYIKSSDTTLAKSLELGGYHTFHTGKWHNGKPSFQNSFKDGSNIFFGGMYSHYFVPTFEFDANGNYTKENQNTGLPLHSSELYADTAIKFIENYNDDKPFFLNVAFQAPHDPREMPVKFLEMYDPEKIKLPTNFLSEHPFDNGELDVRDELLASIPRIPNEIKENIVSYYAMITHLDEQIGHILSALEKKGLMENTIIIFTGDNGLAVGQHGLMGKQSLYEHSIRVPLIFVGPNIPKGKKVDNKTYLFDIYPTLCDLVKVKIPNTVEGKSLNAIIQGQNQELYDAQLYAYKNFQRAIKKDNWKLIKYNVKGEVTTQLFDLKEDPYEINDLSKLSKYNGKLLEMTGLLQELIQKYNDSVDLSKPNWGVQEIPSWSKRASEKEI